MAAKMISGIYAIVNTVNGKRYYGSSVNMDGRKRQHWSDLRNGKHSNLHLQSAWNKYGEFCFVFVVVEQTMVEELELKEQVYIDENHGGYNIEPNAVRSGGFRSKETRQKISQALKGLKRTPEQNAQNAACRTGKPLSEVTKRRVSRGMKRHFKAYPKPSIPASESHKRNVSEGLRRYYASNHDALSKKLKADDVRSIMNLFGHCRIADIARQNGVSVDSIYNIRCGRHWSHVTGIVFKKKSPA